MAGQYSTSTASSGSRSQSTNTSESSGTPVAVQTPQSEFDLSLSELLSNLGQQQLTWATNQYNMGLGVTDANIENYITEANNANQQYNTLWGQYQNVFNPLADQMVQEANEYASTPMQQFQAGLAQSDTMQAANQQKNAAEAELQGYGIDPSSGRYADLIGASDTAAAAAAAGAGTEAALATQQTGRQLQQAQETYGESLPGESVNALSAATGAIGGAENSIISQLNAGSNLMNMPANYFNDAMQLKLPPVGEQTQSSSSGQSTSSSQSVKNASSQPSGQNGGGNGGSGGNSTYTDPQNPVSGFSNTSGPSAINHVESNGAGGGYGQYTGQASGTGEGGGFGGSPSDWEAGAGEGTTSEAMAGGGPVQGGGRLMPSYAQGGQNGVLPSPRPNPGGPTTGGNVPVHASPSRGAATDDIPARLNAEEFVIPRDVKKWKGEEFFHKLIMDARKARMQHEQAPGAPGAEMKPPLPGPPAFTSHHAAPSPQQGVIPSRNLGGAI